MSLLFAGFLIILCLTFAVIVFATRPTSNERALDQRLSTINRSTLSDGNESSTATSRLMKTHRGTGWCGELIERYEFARKLQLLIVQADSKTSLDRLAFMIAAFAIAALLITLFLIPSLLLVQLSATLAVAALPLLMLVYKRRKRLKNFNAELGNAVDMMSNALRAGHSVVGAIGILSEQTLEPARSEFTEVFRQQNFGLPLREALMQMLDRVPSEDLRVVVTAILVQKETGGNLGEILDRTVFVIRERVRIRGEIQVQTAQGRLTGWILCSLPVLLLVAINLINPGYSAVLLHDPVGHKLIYLGIGLLVTGMLVINRMISKIEV